MNSWTIRRDGEIVARERQFRTAKQTAQSQRRANPASTITVKDPTGRLVMTLKGVKS